MRIRLVTLDDLNRELSGDDRRGACLACVNQRHARRPPDDARPAARRRCCGGHGSARPHRPAIPTLRAGLRAGRRHACLHRRQRRSLGAAEVLVLAGHGDHTVDWRTSIGVAARYPQGMLFVADDDHMFARMGAAGTYEALLRAFLAGGRDSEGFRRALARAGAQRWRE